MNAVILTSAEGAELSGNMSSSDLKRHISILSLGSIHRSWTAHAKEGGPLGLSLGLESTFVFRRDLLNLGDAGGIVPKTVPVPRMWASWDLPEEIQVSTSFAPGALYDGISAFGLGGQWIFFRDDESLATASALIHYSYTDAFGDLKSNTVGAAAQISRDLDIWQPYAGAGVLFNGANLNASLAAAGVDTSPHQVAPHVYFGARVDLAAKIAFQVDLADLKPSVSILLSNSF